MGRGAQTARTPPPRRLALGEPGTEAGTYTGMFRANVDTITEALGS